jgi:PAS domain S-box-containing protein
MSASGGRRNGVRLDVTERQQAEAKLREGEEQYRRAITAAGAVPYYIDYAAESYRFIGEAIEALTGYTVNEITPTLLGQMIKETIMTGQGRQLSREEAIQQARAGDLAGWNADYRLVDRSGQTHWLNDASVQVLNEQGQPIGAIGILQDVTERKRLEHEFQASLEQRSRQVQTSIEVAQHIAAAPQLEELFHRVVTLIKERFGYYHVQLFRYEPAEDAVKLITGYGEIGQKMLASGHKLAMGRGVVGTAAATGQSILAADAARDLDWRPNPNLPNTRGEQAVPIKLGSGDAE